VQKLGLATPYAVAVALYLMAPLLSGLVKFSVSAALTEGRVGQQGVDDARIPYYLTPKMIDDYVEYATDAAQVVPALLLPIVGAVYGFSSGIPVQASLAILLVATLAAFAMLAWMIRTIPSDYVCRKKWGYSFLSLTGISLNLAAMGLALGLS
jgi:hypothetical protein